MRKQEKVNFKMKDMKNKTDGITLIALVMCIQGGLLLGEHRVVGVSVAEGLLSSAQVNHGALACHGVVFGEACRPTVAHLIPTDCRRLCLHLGVDEEGDRSARAPWTAERVVAVDAALFCLDGAVLEDISVFRRL